MALVVVEARGTGGDPSFRWLPMASEEAPQGHPGYGELLELFSIMGHGCHGTWGDVEPLASPTDIL